MYQKLSSLVFTMLGFGGLGYYLINYQGFSPDQIIPAFGAAFLLWFVFWFAWAFRWVVVVAPVTITYIMFAFYGFDERVVGTGAVISVVLFVLTGIQQSWGNRHKRKQEKEAKKQYDKLKRKFGD